MTDESPTQPAGETRPDAAAHADDRLSTVRGYAIALIGAALLTDAAAETITSGSPVRWWAVGVATLYLTITAATWRRHIGWRGRLSIALVNILGLVAATAWLAGGLTDGIRLLGQPTTRVVAALVAAGVALACAALLREQRVPLIVRSGVGALAAYGAIAFVAGAIDSTPLVTLLAGASLWRRLPTALQGAFVGGFIVLPLGLVVSVVRAGLRRPRDMSVHADVWKLTAIATSMATVLAAVPLPLRSRANLLTGGLATKSDADIRGSRPSSAELTAALANSLRAIEDGERDAPRDRWDPVYVASQLGADPQRVFSWVRTSTSWIPYRGMLRGPAGVLMDRVGNSLDRAVLLATLLGQSKQPVRLAHASLSRDQAAKLLPRVFFALTRAAPPVARQSGDIIAAVAGQYHIDEASLRRTLASQVDAQAKRRAQLQARVPEQARRLAAAVGQRSTDRTRTNIDRTMDALQDHWWVQARQGDAWQDFDVLGAPNGAAPVSPSETFDRGALPDDVHHQMIVRVVAEQWAGGVLTERMALERALRPAELIGAPIALQFTPVRAPTQPPPASLDSSKGLRAAMLDQHEWVPILMIGRSPIVQSAILDTGELSKPGAEALVRQAGRDAAGFAKSAGDLFNPAGPPAAPPPSPLPSKFLTAAWIDYEIRAPGARPQKIRRAVFDLIGPSARAASRIAAPRTDETTTLTRSLALMMGTEILPIACRFAPQFLTHLAAQGVLDNKDLLTQVVRGDFTDDFAHAQEVAKRFAPMPTPLYGLASARFEWSRVRDAVYIDQLNILTRHVFFSPASNGFKLQAATDIVANDVGVDLLAQDPFAIRLEQGVLDTNAEAILASDRPDASNAGWAFEGSESWTAYSSAADPRLGALQLPADVRQRIGGDLAEGNMVVAPAKLVTIGTDTFAGWWRVDPATGHTLGIGATGWGQAMPEWAMTVLTIGTMSATAFLFEYLWCKLTGGGGAYVARSCEPSPPDRHPAALDYFIAPLEAADTYCLWSALEAAFLAVGFGLAGGMGGGGFGGEPGGAPGKPGRGGGEPGGGGEPPPDLAKTPPDLGDTLKGPPPGGAGRSGGGGGNRSSGGGGEETGGSGRSGAGADADDAALDEALRRAWDAQERGDEQGFTDAIRDMARITSPQRYLKYIPPPGEPAGAGPPKPPPPVTPPPPPPPPPCVGTGCDTSPMAKSIGGMGGAFDVLKKGGKQ